ncbi:MAG: helix-turn-helix transcriptional regulator, partial [Clostridia bacterium]|nr:helix-turn-helix transcriptional regulator [Clostridia bacterium]
MKLEGKEMQYDYVITGRLISKLRKERGLSQEVLSGLAGISRSHLAMIENG